MVAQRRYYERDHIIETILEILEIHLGDIIGEIHQLAFPFPSLTMLFSHNLRAAVTFSFFKRSKVFFLFSLVVLRWGVFPDVVAFALLLMNMSAPLIDRYTRPRVYGK